MKKVLMGNHAAAVAAKLARVQVASAYPITPQTQCVEMLAEMEASGEFRGRLLRVESEHSAMATLIGAATAGARTFTATSSQGLAYMHELLHWASGARLPIVMVDVNRALAAPWCIWTDQTDSLSQRDTGWLQFYCSNNQEVLDSVLIAYRVAEATRIPAMVALDGFVLSHSYEPVDVPSQEDVDAYLPPWRPETVLDPAHPAAFGTLPTSKEYMRLRRVLADDMADAVRVIEEEGRRFEHRFGRYYGLVEPYLVEDAETVLVTSGAPASTARVAVDELRREGFKAGNIRVRTFRPFPAEALRRLARPGARWAVVDRNYSMGHHGIFCEELKSALYGAGSMPEVSGFVAGLGGCDITVELLKEIWHEARSGGGRISEPVWMEDAR